MDWQRSLGTVALAAIVSGMPAHSKTEGSTRVMFYNESDLDLCIQVYRPDGCEHTLYGVKGWLSGDKWPMTMADPDGHVQEKAILKIPKGALANFTMPFLESGYPTSSVLTDHCLFKVWTRNPEAHFMIIFTASSQYKEDHCWLERGALLYHHPSVDYSLEPSGPRISYGKENKVLRFKG